MNPRGLIVIALIVVIGCAAGGWAWWHKYHASHQAMEYFGPEHARRIKIAPRFTLSELTPYERRLSGPPSADETRRTLDFDDNSYYIETGVKVHDLKGMVHLRHALIQDTSYHWMDSIASNLHDRKWKYLMVFLDDEGETKIVLDPAAHRLKLVPDGVILSYEPMAEGVDRVLGPIFDDTRSTQPAR